MAHIRREKIGYKSNDDVQNFNDIVCIPANQYLVSISTTSDVLFLAFVYKYAWILYDSSIYVNGLTTDLEDY